MIFDCFVRLKEEIPEFIYSWRLYKSLGTSKVLFVFPRIPLKDKINLTFFLFNVSRNVKNL